MSSPLIENIWAKIPSFKTMWLMKNILSNKSANFLFWNMLQQIKKMWGQGGYKTSWGSDEDKHGKQNNVHGQQCNFSSWTLENRSFRTRRDGSLVDLSDFGETASEFFSILLYIVILFKIKWIHLKISKQVNKTNK